MARRHHRRLAAIGATAVLLSGCGADPGSDAPSAQGNVPDPVPRAPRCVATTDPSPGGGDLVKVPKISYGVSVAAARRTLERAGLVGHSPDVDWPHYATGTRPRAGTSVPAGCLVMIRIGDG